MKKPFLRFLSILMIGFMFFSCANSTGGDSDDSNTQKQQQQNNSGKTNSGKTNSGTTNNGTTDSGTTDSGTTDSGTTDDGDEQKDDTPAVNRNIGVTFNFTGAQALAKLEAKQDGSRAVTNVDELGDLVKILADGSMENAITVGENCSLSDIVAIYKSPLEDSKDIFIVFNGNSVLGYEEVEKEYEWGGTYTDRQEIRVGQLICLHEDGSIADILKKDDATDYWNTHMSLKTESVTFDAAGNVYFISSDNGDMIYQFDPKTNELVKMVASVENTYYEKMQIDDEGEWIFVSGNRYTGSSSYFLRAIPINNPNSPVNIYYSSNYEMDPEKWIYDNKNEMMYFIVNDGNKAGLFTASKAGGFRNKTFHESCVGESFNDNLFESYIGSKSSFCWKDSVKTDGAFDSTKAVQFFIDRVIGFWDCQTQEEKRISRDDVDIRFDKFACAKGSLKALAVLTAGKKNEEAFEALNNLIGMDVLYSLSGKDEEGYNWYEYVNNKGYRNYLWADILYLKDTDILLVDSDEIIFEYAMGYAYDESNNYILDENSNPTYVMKGVKGIDLLEKQADGFYSRFSGLGELLYYENSWQESINSFSFTSRFYGQDNSSRTIVPSQLSEDDYFYAPLNAKAVLEYLFSFCNVEGEKELRLTSFKDDEKYSSLYTTLTNEQAIEWLAADVERLSLFGEVAGVISYWFEEDYMPKLSYSVFMNLLSRTCFIAGTDQKAITWNWNNEGRYQIPYDYYRWNTDGSKISGTDTGIYYEYYNTSGNDPFYYIVQVADADGKMVELVNKLPLPAGKVVKSEKNKDRILLQYSVMDENGAEFGYHHIYSVEMANGLVTNCFDNVPNRNNLEVVSFNSAGDLLYYSAVRGTLVENGIVNLITNEYNPLTVQRKMVAVYTFN